MQPYSRKVYYYETDRMGIVHHSNYIRMFEETRIDYMEKVGMPYPKMEEDGIIIPVISVGVDYKYSLKYGDIFSVYMKLTKFNGIKFRCEYEIKNGDGQTCATGYSEHCFLNRDMKLFKFRSEFPEYHEMFQKAVES